MSSDLILWEDPSPFCYFYCHFLCGQSWVGPLTGHGVSDRAQKAPPSPRGPHYGRWGRFLTHIIRQAPVAELHHQVVHQTRGDPVVHHVPNPGELLGDVPDDILLSLRT